MERGLELSGVSRVVAGELYLDDISAHFEPGTFTTLLGRTRAGKTSLLRLIAGLDRPTRGRVSFRGEDITHREVQKRDVAMVYQQFINYPSLTVYENIASPLRVQRALDRRELDRRVRDTAALLRIDHLLDRLPEELSGGQQQRTAIARALAKGASLLLLDEPLANLDYKLREELREELRTLFRTTGALVLYATAEPTEALLLGGATAVMHEGRLMQHGSAHEVYARPGDEVVASIISDPPLNLLDAELKADGTLALRHVPYRASTPRTDLAPGRYRLGIRANHVRFARRSEADWNLQAIVVAREVTGSETLLHARAGEVLFAAHTRGVHPFELGAEVALFFAPSDLFFFPLAESERGSAASERVHGGA